MICAWLLMATDLHLLVVMQSNKRGLLLKCKGREREKEHANSHFGVSVCGSDVLLDSAESVWLSFSAPSCWSPALGQVTERCSSGPRGTGVLRRSRCRPSSHLDWRGGGCVNRPLHRPHSSQHAHPRSYINTTHNLLLQRERERNREGGLSVFLIHFKLSSQLVHEYKKVRALWITNELSKHTHTNKHSHTCMSALQLTSYTSHAYLHAPHREQFTPLTPLFPPW